MISPYEWMAMPQRTLNHKIVSWNEIPESEANHLPNLRLCSIILDVWGSGVDYRHCSLWPMTSDDGKGES